MEVSLPHKPNGLTIINSKHEIADGKKTYIYDKLSPSKITSHWYAQQMGGEMHLI
jgi:hypothetical protein